MNVEFRQAINHKLLYKIQIDKKPNYNKGIILPDGCYYKINNMINVRGKLIIECQYSSVIR